jgi:membrane protein implicated in regulation of membrane protease activity
MSAEPLVLAAALPPAASTMPVVGLTAGGAEAANVDSLSPGAIAGAVIGFVAVAVMLGYLVYRFLTRRTRKHSSMKWSGTE